MNQYRCENCNFKKNVKRATYSPNLIECRKTECELSKDDQEFISKIGCASHSDAKTMQCTVCGSEATHPHCDICFGLVMVNHRQDEWERVLKTLKKDLQTRFIPSNNQWSKGRNSGLLECCNIIDEELRQKDGE
jgi:hypothetical protein